MRTAAPSAPGERRRDIIAGLKLAGPMMLGVVALGLAFGVLVSAAGFAWWWAPILSTAIYAGSMEFVALSLITGGAGAATVALSTFVVNFRHLFYGLTHPRPRGGAGAYVLYSLTDEAYAVFASRPRAKKETVIAAHLALQAVWVIPGAVGAALGPRLPFDSAGIEFVMPALFCALAVDAYRTTGTAPMVVVSLVCFAVSSWMFPAYALVVSLSVYAAIALVPGWIPLRGSSRVVQEGSSRVE